jgi:hypothetical protein
MASRRQRNPSLTVAEKAQMVLAFALERARVAADWVQLDNAIFGIDGKATELFTTEAERIAFSKTPERKRISELLDTLPQPPVRDMGDLQVAATGTIHLLLPRSLHASLLSEAKNEGVSLNDLCLYKLIAQLRAVV